MKAKPFVKWAGRKKRLVKQLGAKLPADFDNWGNAIYIMPFTDGRTMHLCINRQKINIQ